VTTVAEAERIKTLYGTLIKASSDAAEMIAYPVASEEEGGLHQTSKAHVQAVIAPRLEGLLDLAAERLGEAGLTAFAGRRVVLTGGASQLLGLDQAWSRRFGGSARIGRPRPIDRMSASMASPAFATVVGLMQVAARPHLEVRSVLSGMERERGYLGRIERWIRDSF
jgi:cell division protein FtsA